MRIVAGDFKGRRLIMPEGKDVRPTTEKVKEAIFSMIQFDLEDAVCIDVFAGIGNLGLEALSRGASHCYFCDASRQSLDLVRRNVEMCKAEEYSTMMQGDYSKTLASINEQADIIFLDPPYRMGLMLDCFEKIRENDRLAEDGIIVAEHGEREILDEEISGFVKIKEKKYGSIVVSIYGHNA